MPIGVPATRTLQQSRIQMAFELPPLPYDLHALEPHISAKTLEFHHGKHHKTYVDTLNKLVAGTPDEDKSLEDLIRGSASDESKKTIFNNAAQIWNHNFFWPSLKPNGSRPSGDISGMLDKSFGGIDQFKEQFKKEAVGQFGSGWAWLVFDKGALKIVKTHDADLPLLHGQTALVTCDVWEHAYYLDYQNRRPDFVQTFLDHLINWDFVAENLQKAS